MTQVQVDQGVVGSQITVEIYRELPPGVSCIQVRTPYSGAIPLNSILPPGCTRST
jgi:hypothetical protein